MIKLKSILTESSKRAIDIDIKKFRMLLRGKANIAWKKHLEEYRIFRGRDHNDIRAPSPYKFISPSKTYRMSRNTINVVNSFLDILPSWKNWPKRSNSIICSNSRVTAGWYGVAFQVFPFNNAKIGICSQSDFWESFPVITERFSKHNVDSFNYVLSAAYNTFGIDVDPDNFKPEDAKKLIDYLNKETLKYRNIDFLYKTDTSKGNATQRHDSKTLKEDMIIFYKGGDWTDYFDELLSPEKNNFKLVSISEYTAIETPRKEVWTDADSLMIHTSYLEKIENRKLGVNVTNADGTKERWPIKGKVKPPLPA